jgi:recombinational DNA repair ATPase RecF
MAIVKLVAENFKKLKLVEITPGDDNMIVLSGKNAQGKSSVIDSIIATLGGKKSKVEAPIRHGEKQAKTVIETEKYIIQKTWNESGSVSLVVKTQKGVKVSSPQTLLDGFLSMLSFDPTHFMRIDYKEQGQYLLDMLGLNDQIAEIDNEINNLSEVRKNTKRDLKNAKSVYKTMDIEDGPTDIKTVDEVNRKIESAKERNTERRRISENISVAQNKIENATTAIHEYETQIEALKKKIENEEKNKEEASKLFESESKALKDIGEEEDISEYAREIQTINEQNRKAEARIAKKKQKEIIDTFTNDVNGMTNQIESLRNKKKEILDNAKYPIDGLSYEDGVVIYNNKPIQDASSSEQLRISVAIAMALNPELKILMIKDASILDSDSMKVLEDMVKENGYQAWIEVVDESGEVGFVLEDGNIISDEETRKMSKEK